jgi:hypothetical protein
LATPIAPSPMAMHDEEAMFQAHAGLIAAMARG